MCSSCVGILQGSSLGLCFVWGYGCGLGVGAGTQRNAGLSLEAVCGHCGAGGGGGMAVVWGWEQVAVPCTALTMQPPKPGGRDVLDTCNRFTSD